jgi:3-methylfumaryl-CoA hydratase
MNVIAGLEGWLGRTRTDEDELALYAVRRFAVLLDQDPDGLRRGDPVPESWYCILFGEVGRQSTLSADGHTEDEFRPPIANLRRMFGGRRVTFHRPLKIGDDVTRVSTVTGLTPKEGSSGPFTLMTITHTISTKAGLAITEEQDVVYRLEEPDFAAKETKPAVSKPATATAAAPAPDWSVAWRPDEALLFRYSALTYNAHRIHYDLTYTKEVEGYPQLVINGGLTTLMLLETAKKNVSGRVTGFAGRAVRPMFIGMTAALCGQRTDTGAKVWAQRPDGSDAYRLDLTVEKAS